MVDAKYADGLRGPASVVWASVFARQRAFAEHAFDQLDDAGFFRVVAPGLNSVGVIARHLAGNMASRWTDFLTTDGEKATRDRDAELAPIDPSSSAKELAAKRETIIKAWGRGWACVDSAIAGLTEGDLDREVMIRGKPHSVTAAVVRQIDHYSFHVGQINVIARQIVGTDRWKWFTLPPGGTRAFNDSMFGGG